MKTFGLLFVIGGLIFVAIGGGMAWSQHRKITTYQSVTATVLGTRIERRVSHSKNGTSTTYKPIVTYRYAVRGTDYVSDEVLPLSQSASHSWARSVTGRFKVNQVVEAYYDPSSPQESFLLREYTFTPYAFMLFPMLFVAMGLGVGFAASGSGTRAPPAPKQQPDGWFAVRPALRIADKRRAAWMMTALWFAVGLLACGHYFLSAAPPWETAAWVGAGAYGAVGCVPMGLALYYFLLRRHVFDATLLANAGRFEPGQQVAVMVEQPVLSNLLVTELSAALVCEETVKTKSGGKTSISTSTRHREQVSLLKDRQARPRDVLSAQHTLAIPADQPPSSPAGFKGYPRFAWRFEVVTRIENGPDYRAKFPITVQGAAPATGK
jgi:hypothetical protein